MTVGGMGFIPERLLMMMMILIMQTCSHVLLLVLTPSAGS